MKKSELQKIIREEYVKLNEADYSFQNIRIDVYDDDITIKTSPKQSIDLKFDQIPKVIDLLKKISK